jgi:hypothetical protein
MPLILKCSKENHLKRAYAIRPYIWADTQVCPYNAIMGKMPMLQKIAINCDEGIIRIFQSKASGNVCKRKTSNTQIGHL